MIFTVDEKNFIIERLKQASKLIELPTMQNYFPIGNWTVIYRTMKTGDAFMTVWIINAHAEQAAI